MPQQTAGFAGVRPADTSSTFAQRATARPGAGVESVIPDGSDREAVDDASTVPWRMVCALEITGQNGFTIRGTGWLAGPRTVITAGHCVFDGPNLGGFAATIAVTPGLQVASAPFGIIQATGFRTLARWRDAADPEFDIGAISLASNVGLQAGFFAAGVRDSVDLESHFAHVSGYPTDLEGGIRQFHHRHGVKAARERRLFYTTDTSEGQSGAPVWIVDTDAGPPLVVGVHTYGDERTPGSLKPANSATRITAEMVTQIRAWVNEDLPT